MEPFIGQIMMFAGNFAPRGWALCNGQLLPIAQNTALFSILGTTYGGDGKTTFALPDLRGRFPMSSGNGPGLTPRPLGEKSGSESVTLTVANMPAHNHSLSGNAEDGTSSSPEGGLLSAVSASDASNIPRIYGQSTRVVPLAASSVGATGGSQPVGTMPPFEVVNFMIALEGIYPSRD